MHVSQLNMTQFIQCPIAQESYEPISAKEAADLINLMQECDDAVTNADKFMAKLTGDLNLLDGANIKSIMASEENIDKLMEMLESAIDHTGQIESRLNQYNDHLEHIKETIDKREGKNISLETVNHNNKRLLMTLETMLTQLELSAQHQVRTDGSCSLLVLPTFTCRGF